jgi:predicted phage tail protein
MENPVTFVFVMVSMFVFYGWVAWIILEWRRLTRKTQLHKALIERFASSGELQTFLVSESGERLFKSLSMGVLSPKDKILNSFSRGLIVALLGISLLVVSLVLPEYASFFLAAGIIIIALGVGLLLSGLLSMRIGRKWGLFEK